MVAAGTIDPGKHHLTSFFGKLRNMRKMTKGTMRR